MSGSRLGPLPGFGTKRGSLTGALSGGSGDMSQLDSALDSLLDASSGPVAGPGLKEVGRSGDETRLKAGGMTRQGSSGKLPQPRRGSRDSGGQDFYSKLASLANDSFGDSEEEEEEEVVTLTEADTRRLAEAVDLDDMEANLFGSFGRRGSRQSRSKPGPRKEQSRSEGRRKGSLDSGEAAGLGGVPVMEKKDGALGAGRPKELTSRATLKRERPTAGTDLQDDLQDLLSDSGDEAAPFQGRKEKPRIQLVRRKGSDLSSEAELTSSVVAQQSKHEDGKPITSGQVERGGGGGGGGGGGEDDEEESMDLELPGFEVSDRPKTSHGRSTDTTVTQSNSGGEGGEEEEGRGTPDILRVDSPPHPLPSGTRPKRKEKAVADSSGNVDFWANDEDILSGMGLDDSDVRPPTITNSSREDNVRRQPSTLDDLLGLRSRKKETKGDEMKTPVLVVKGGSKEREEEEEEEEEREGYLFGGYQPSAAGGSTVESGVKSKGLPLGRRRSSLSDVLTSRPSTAPSQPGKKSVRFADTVEVSDRPSTSPAVGEGEPQSSESVRERGRGGRGGGGGGRRLSTETEREESQIVRKPPVPQQQEEEIKDKSTELPLPRAESTSMPVSQGRRRNRASSVQKSSAAELFEESQASGWREETGESGGDGGKDSTGEPKPLGETISDKVSLSPVEKLEHPVFPWQQAKPRPTGGTSISKEQTGKESTVTARKREEQEEEVRLGGSEQGAAELASLQKQLLQQQKEMGEQISQLQSLRPHDGDEIGGRRERRVSAEEGERGQLRALRERVEELEGLLEKGKRDQNSQQEKLADLQSKLRESGEGHVREEESEALRKKIRELENSAQQMQLELTSKNDELKLKLHRAEVERDHLKQTCDGAEERHAKEIAAIHKSNEAKLQALEESFQRREARWQQEAELETSRHQEHLQKAERDKTDATITLQKKLEALEVSKTNEITRLQDIHRTSLEEVRREHELERQRLRSLHQHEVAALKAAHSHTHLLSELTRQVEASTREVGVLGAKVSHAHTQGLDERERNLRAQEEHLKVIEERMSRQQVENEQERDRLQTLTAKLETHISQQSRQIEQERWQLQQETSRLKARQTAFEEERNGFLQRMEEEREQLQQAKEKFLSEQQEVLSQCYEEQRALASERAELSVVQKRAHKQDRKGLQKSLQSEVELAAGLARLREEKARLSVEAARLREEREEVEAERKKLEEFGLAVQQRSKEVEEMCRSALLVREQGEVALGTAQALREEALQESEELQAKMAELRERETQLATDQLTLAQERRALQHESLTTHRPGLRETGGHSLQPPPSYLGQDKPTSDRPALHPSHSLSLLSTSCPPSSALPTSPYPPLPALTPHPTPHDHKLTTLPRGPVGYCPSVSPVHQSLVVSVPSPAVRARLAQLQQSRSLRQMAEKDQEDLEEETRFLESLQNSSLLCHSTSSLVAT